MIQALIIAFVGAEFLILYLWRARRRVGLQRTPAPGAAPPA
jgi:hypothetical protein